MRSMRILSLLAALLALGAMALGAQAEDFLGKPLADFSVETIDGEIFTLSRALEDRDMVLINLWATWCPPCEREFPFLQEAYEQYGDRVAVLALSIEPQDTPEKLREYADAHGMTFPVGSDVALGLADAFGVVSIPTSVVVDRFGNVALAEAKSQTSAAKFTALFDYFLDDAYTQTTVLDSFPQPKPNVARVSEAALSAAGGGALALRNPEDAGIWPMVPDEIDGRSALVSTNRGIEESRCAVCLSVTASEGDALAFDFKTSLEPAYDALFVQLDGETVKRFTGEHDWTAWAIELAAGAHELVLGCEKDYTGDGGEDRAWIASLRLLGGDEAAGALAALPPRPTAEADGLTVANAGMRRVEFDDPYSIIEGSFGVDWGWMVNGNAVTVEIALADGRDPETAFVRSMVRGEQPLSGALNGDGTGYSLDLPVGAGEAGDFDVLMLYPDTWSADASEVQSALLFADEDGADAFVAYLARFGYEVGWRYGEADG